MKRTIVPTKGVLCGVLAAGGSGERAARALPKQFADVGGKPLFLHALAALLHPSMAAAVVVVPERYIAVCRAALPRDLADRVGVVAGGSTRQASVRRGLEALEGRSADWVLVHDAARPFLSADLVARLLAGAREGCGTIPVVPVADSVVMHDGSTVGRYADRDRLGLVQTPQLFPYPLLLAAHRAAADGSRRYTDDASLFMDAGHRVTVVTGEADNVKVTYARDLRRAEDSLGGPRR